MISHIFCNIQFVLFSILSKSVILFLDIQFLGCLRRINMSEQKNTCIRCIYGWYRRKTDIRICILNAWIKFIRWCNCDVANYHKWVECTAIRYRFTMHCIKPTSLVPWLDRTRVYAAVIKLSKRNDIIHHSWATRFVWKIGVIPLLGRKTLWWASS